MTRHRFRAEKLVRNKTNERLSAKNVFMKYHIADTEEYKKLLGMKLIEEATEVITAKNTDEMINELADVLEVLHCMIAAHNLSLETVEISRQEKLKTRGSFDDRICSEYVDIDESHPLYAHYKSEPEKYPEIELHK
jgi:predicted house-cleaning noncanonical NTP pyrophosphatase (MazG superfamily)